MHPDATVLGPSSEDNAVVEKRASQRVRDAIGLELSVVSTPAGPDLTPDSKPVLSVASGQPRQRIRKYNKYAIKGYADVKRDQPAVADYIDELEERIRTLLLQGDRTSEHPTHKVSLSASGLAFAENEVFEVDAILSLRMTLFPSLAHIECLGRIISAGDAPEVGQSSKHTYRLTFIDISAEDQDVVDKHVQVLQTGLAKYVTD